MLKLSPDRFWEFSKKLFEQQKEFFDANVVNETRNNTYNRLAKLAGSVGVDEGKVFDMLKISEKPGEDGSLNTGNQVTNDIKLMVKANRRTGVHVTPTVLFNGDYTDFFLLMALAEIVQGIEEGSISSSFTGQQWDDWLQKNVT